MCHRSSMAHDLDGVGPQADPSLVLMAFMGRVLVVCPRCGGRAENVRPPGLPEVRFWNEHLFDARRLVCGGCGLVDDWVIDRNVGVPMSFERCGRRVDLHFGRALWLQTRCAGEVLWALNIEHVEQLGVDIESAAAGGDGRMFQVLPRWMKEARNRGEVREGLERLRRLAELSGVGDRSDLAY